MKYLRLMLLLMILMGLAAVPAAANLDGNLLRYDPTYGLYYAATDSATITWPPGTYDVGPDWYQGVYLKHAFVLDPSLPPNLGHHARPNLGHHARTNLTIMAYGVTLNITDPTIGVFKFAGCNGLEIKGVTVRYDPLPYNQSTITSLDLVNHTFDVVLDAGYLGFEDPRFSYGPISSQPPTHGNWGSIFDPVTTLTKAGTLYHDMTLSGTQALGGGHYRLSVHPQAWAYLTYAAVGDRFTYLMRRDTATIFGIRNCEPTFDRPPVLIEDCTAESGPQAFIAMTGCPRVSNTGQSIIRGCTITNVSSDRLVSVNADGMYLASSRVGPLVEDCWLERMHDDGINLFTPGRLFMEYPIPGNYQVVKFSSGPRLVANDVLELFDPATGLVGYFSIRAILASGPGGEEDWQVVQLSSAVPGMIGDGTGLDWQTSTHAFNLNCANPEFLVSENTIRNNAGRGAILAASSGTMYGNTLEGMSSNGIAVANVYAAHFPGGDPVPLFIDVRANTIRDCAYLWPSWSLDNGSSIMVGGMRGYPGGISPYKTAPLFVLQGNTIENWNSAGIYAHSITTALIKETTLVGVVDDETPGIVVGYPAGALSVEGVFATGASGLDYAVRIEHGVDADVTATGIWVTAPTLPLQDLR